MYFIRKLMNITEYWKETEGNEIYKFSYKGVREFYLFTL